MRKDRKAEVLSAAESACRTFAACQKSFFNFERRTGWRGWENWLTVDIARRLNQETAVPFCRYLTSRERFDLAVFDGERIAYAIEIKTSYFDDAEIAELIPGEDGLPERVLRDRDKLDSLKSDIGRMILVSICFESSDGCRRYRRSVESKIHQDFRGWRATWRDCSVKRRQGWNLLLAL
jgi:hypothetical protein